MKRGEALDLVERFALRGGIELGSEIVAYEVAGVWGLQREHWRVEASSNAAGVVHTFLVYRNGRVRQEKGCLQPERPEGCRRDSRDAEALVQVFLGEHEEYFGYVVTRAEFKVGDGRETKGYWFVVAEQRMATRAPIFRFRVSDAEGVVQPTDTWD